MGMLVLAYIGEKRAHPFLYWAEFLAASFFMSEKRNKIPINPQNLPNSSPSQAMWLSRASPFGGQGSGLPLTARSPESTTAPSLSCGHELPRALPRGSQALVSLFAESQLDLVTYLNNKALERISIGMLLSSFQIYSSE